MYQLKIKRRCQIRRETPPLIAALYISIQKEQIDISFSESICHVKDQAITNGNLEESPYYVPLIDFAYSSI